ncbi:TlpA family protein disulfide reductase [Aequorivita marisscotiae]|uniref:TlpA disulfide reductase family protein n=1 Tax=Aequorivita marisscotiae TaxID=3040348 RepID=A0ABY8KW71_9FLAO|nr:TlpA disulfide reductase family protein [Aequorivita sp. Ant34-E75]WGF93203.1 TlpA disulfide reductase family protein [Aequorivita sp. Ant34-E75]
MKNINFIWGVLLGFLTPIIVGTFILFYNKKIERPIVMDINSLEIIGTDGTSLRLNTINENGLLINFWATWCAPCISEMPFFHEIENEEKIKVIALSNQKMDIIRKFVKENEYSFMIAQYRVSNDEIINVLPTTVLLNQNQEVVWSKSGSVTKTELNKAIKMLNKQ